MSNISLYSERTTYLLFYLGKEFKRYSCTYVLSLRNYVGRNTYRIFGRNVRITFLRGFLFENRLRFRDVPTRRKYVLRLLFQQQHRHGPVHKIVYRSTAYRFKYISFCGSDGMYISIWLPDDWLVFTNVHTNWLFVP